MIQTLLIGGTVWKRKDRPIEFGRRADLKAPIKSEHSKFGNASRKP